MRRFIGSPLWGPRTAASARQNRSEKLRPPSVHALRASMDAFGRHRIRVVGPPVRMRRRRSASALDRRRHGRELARLPVEAGEVAARCVQDHTFASRGEKRNRSRSPSIAPGTMTRLSKIILCGLVRRRSPRGPAARTRRRRRPPTSIRLGRQAVEDGLSPVPDADERARPSPVATGPPGVPCRRWPTEGLSPILIVPPR